MIELAFLFGFFRVVFGLRFFWLARRRSQIAQRPSTYATDSEDEGGGDEDNVTGARNNPSFVCNCLMMPDDDRDQRFAKTICQDRLGTFAVENCNAFALKRNGRFALDESFGRSVSYGPSNGGA